MSDHRRQLKLPPNVGLIAFLPLIVLVTSELLLIFFANRGFVIPQGCCSPRPSVFAEAAGRLQIIVVLSVFAFAVVALAIKIITDLTRDWDLNDHRSMLWIVGLGVVAVSVIGVLTWQGTWPETRSLVGQGIFDEVFALVPPTTNWPPIWNKQVLEWIVLVHGVATGLASITMVVGVVYCTGEPAGRKSGVASAEDRKEIWLAQNERFRLYLYLGTGALALGVLFMRAWTLYPTFALGVATEYRAAYVGAVNAYVGFVGIQFTMMMAVVVVPMQLVLLGQRDRIAIALVNEGTTRLDTASQNRFNSQVQKKIAEEKMELGLANTVQLLFLILAPLLAGSLPSLTELLS